MGGDTNSGAGDTEVSAYEAEITKQNKGTKKEINKGVNITTYADRKVDTAKNTKTFHESGKVDKIESPFLLLNVGLNAGKDLLNKGSVVTREFFTGKVLNKGIKHKGTHISKTAFEQMSLEKQNEIYAGYMEERMSGKTDAYGNPTGGWRKETVKHKNKDGTYTTKEVWVGGNDGDNRKTELQIETESSTASKQEEAEVKISEEEYKKKRGLKGSRSMFSNAGGRGFLDPV